MAVQTVATLESVKDALVTELYRTKGKAEIVKGRVVTMPPTGDDPGRASGSVYLSLRQFERESHEGRAVPDNVGFLVNLPTRDSFSPDAAYHYHPPSGMGFVKGAPAFAVEVRSEFDYGRTAEREIAEKRDEYFDAGTLIVWDVDLLSEEVVKAYSVNDPDHPRIFRRGEIADAEPVLPGWRMPVDELFD